MQMRRTITSIFLACALLLFPLTERAQESSPAPKAQSAPPAKPSGSTQEQPQQSGQVIPVSVNLVDLLFTVLNRRNKLVPELESTHFKLWDKKTHHQIHH